MSREDANRIALRAIGAILDAAEPLELSVHNTQIAVTPARQDERKWPTARLDGVTEGEDGPWPRGVDLACTWPQGSCKLSLIATHWMPNQQRSHAVSLEISAPEANQALVWLTISRQIRDAEAGDEAQVWANPSIMHRKPEYDRIREAVNEQIRNLVVASKVPLLPPGGRIDAFQIRIPDGDVLPSPARAYQTLIHLALIKLPFLDRGETRATRGQPYIDVDAIIAHERETLADEGAQLSSGKQAIISRMPGGYRNLKTSLDRILGFVATGVSRQQLVDFLEDELETTVPEQPLRLLARLGLVEQDADRFALTEIGRAYHDDSTERRLFDLLHEAFEGVLATLAIAALPGGADTDNTPALLGASTDLSDVSRQQVNRRRNWLVSLDLAERSGGADRITDAGRAILDAYADETAELTARLDSAIELPEDAGGVDDSGDDSDDDPDEPTREPSNWLDDTLDLRAEHFAERVGKLVLPDGLMERVCAALSTGKHLLLVGPPGTGKTELANIIARAARDQGFCAGLYAATASADWSTYETIGGYALDRDNALRFRPGALLRAVEHYQWLLVDELNRADVDKAFGELMTVLSGKTTDTPYEREDGRHISIGPDEDCTHVVPKTFRVLATMNTWDKTSLFRLSYAVQRRFAIVHLGLPSATQYAELLARAATQAGSGPTLDDAALARVQHLFSPDGLLAQRQIGPAVALDMVRYMRRRGGDDCLAEAVAMFLLPQLEGLDDGAAKAGWGHLDAALAGWASAAGIAELRARYLELFPLLAEGA